MRWIGAGAVAALLVAAAGPVSAQRIGVHGNWSDDFDVGVGGRVEFGLPNLFTSEGPFSRTFGIASFDYFFPDCGDPGDPGENFDCTYWEINGGLAIPIAASGVDPYVGAGLNFSRFDLDYVGSVPGAQDFGAADSDVGLNLLGGLRFPLGALSAYAEGRLELGGGDQLILTAGLLVGGTGN